MSNRNCMNATGGLAVLGVVAVSLLMGGAAVAGGWAVTTLDPMPRLPVAGASTPIGFTIRQHGATPIAIDNTAIVIARLGGAERHVFRGRADGPVGHYVSDVRFPTSGAWNWQVEQGWFGTQELGSINVGTGGLSTSAAIGGSPTTPVAVRIALSLSTAAAGAWTLWLFMRTRRARPHGAV